MGDLISTSPFSTTMRVANPRAIHLRLPFDKLLIEDTTGILDRNILISNCHYKYIQIDPNHTGSIIIIIKFIHDFEIGVVRPVQRSVFFVLCIFLDNAILDHAI